MGRLLLLTLIPSPLKRFPPAGHSLIPGHAADAFFSVRSSLTPSVHSHTHSLRLSTILCLLSLLYSLYSTSQHRMCLRVLFIFRLCNREGNPVQLVTALAPYAMVVGLIPQFGEMNWIVVIRHVPPDGGGVLGNVFRGTFGLECGYFDVCTVATTPFCCLLLRAALGRDTSHPQAAGTRGFGERSSGAPMSLPLRSCDFWTSGCLWASASWPVKWS